MCCVSILQVGQSGDECLSVSTLCRYKQRKGDLFVRSWAMVRRVDLGSAVSDACTIGGICL